MSSPPRSSAGRTGATFEVAAGAHRAADLYMGGARETGQATTQVDAADWPWWLSRKRRPN